MSVGLVVELQDSNGDWQDAGALLEDLAGTPVSSAAPSGDGQQLSDLYVLTFSSVVPGVSATALVSARSGELNPYDGNTDTVALDDATEFSQLVPGVVLKFSDSGSFTSSWSASVQIGMPVGEMNAFPPDSATPSEAVKVRVRNAGSPPSARNCKASLGNVVKRVLKTGVVFAVLRPSAPDSTEKVLGAKVISYVLEATNVTGSGPAKTFDLKIDGSSFNVVTVPGGVVSDSTPLGVVEVYRATDGLLESIEFQLSEDAVNSDFENVLAFERRFGQIAADALGAPGDFGTDDVDLTEDLQPTGVITAGGFTYFWFRALVPSGSTTESNPHPCDVLVTGSAYEPSGWTD